MRWAFFLTFFYFITAAEGRNGTSVFAFDCQIINDRGELLRKFPSNNCIYLDDGTVIGSSQVSLKRISPSGEVIWKKDINGHHKVVFLDTNHFLLLNSSNHLYQNELLRFDRISVFDMEGNETKYFDFFDHVQDLKRLASVYGRNYRGDTYIGLQVPPEEQTFIGKLAFIPVFHEFSHANSIFEIPPNNILKKIKAFKRGNVLVNVNGLETMFILSRDFKRILWSIAYPEITRGHSIHDVQMDASRNSILFYENEFDGEASAISKFDPVSKSKTVIFSGRLTSPFFGVSQGGVQELENGSYLISEFNRKTGNKIFIIDRSGKKIWQIEPKSDGVSGLPLEGLQEAKRMKLVGFLNKNRELMPRQ
jgi:hypothetical protein